MIEEKARNEEGNRTQHVARLTKCLGIVARNIGFPLIPQVHVTGKFQMLRIIRALDFVHLPVF
jgi:hypothetical protein